MNRNLMFATKCNDIICYTHRVMLELHTMRSYLNASSKEFFKMAHMIVRHPDGMRFTCLIHILHLVICIDIIIRIRPMHKPTIYIVSLQIIE